jgi:hypothetical protein
MTFVDVNGQCVSNVSFYTTHTMDEVWHGKGQFTCFVIVVDAGSESRRTRRNVVKGKRTARVAALKPDAVRASRSRDV